MESTDKICLECNREYTGIIAFCPHDNAQLFSRVKDPLIGTMLAGKYEILDVLGHGGMGVVYKAHDSLMDRVVAIKILHAQLVSDSMSVKRFQQESKAASRLRHPHVITTFDFGISPTGQPYIVMDFLDGEPLSEVIKRDGNVPVERGIRILSQTCDALDHAHKQGVIHRDLKPSNIVLCKFDGQTDFVRVVDFGVAKLIGGNQEGQRLTQAGEVCGSPVYMSPEQCIGADLDRRSDIYSMGIVIYETLTGRLPIIGKTMVDTMTRHISEIPPRFNAVRPDLYIPERLESVVFKALAKDPAHRHQSMEELMTDLKYAIPRPGRSEILRTLPSPESYEAPKTESAERPRSSLPAIVASIAAVGIVGSGMLFASMHKSRTTPPPQPVTPISQPAQKALSTPTANENKSAGANSTGAKPVTTSQAATTPQPATSTATVPPAVVTKPVKHLAKVRKPMQTAFKGAPPATTPAHKAAAPATEMQRFNSLKDLRSY